ncbi:PREDICTED: 21 kDa protein-like [Lupinus angustifolius]|nr:PREDICTED: 21 kDa protein-like [Lupinus angustifolius]
MENNNFAKPCSPHVITFILFTLLVTIPNITSACTNSTTISTNSTQKINENTPIPSNYSANTFRTYLETSCNSTTYPSICYKYLSPYASKIEADPMKLCNTSLSLALKATKRASSTISEILKMTNLTDIVKAVIKDCLDNVKTSMGQLQDSLAAMGQLDGIDKEFQISNIQTWMSSSITDDQTCSDELDEMNLDATIRDQIRKVVLNAAMVNSNALYFVNKLIY